MTTIPHVLATIGDITTFDVDMIVNAANSALSGGGGVDGAIHRAAGSKLREACRALGRCEVGNAKLTPGFDLKAKWVAHAVGPVWRGGDHDESELLGSCYRRALDLAREAECTSVAFPAISTGAYKFPPDLATKIAVSTVLEQCATTGFAPRIVFVCANDRMHALYTRELAS